MVTSAKAHVRRSSADDALHTSGKAATNSFSGKSTLPRSSSGSGKGETCFSFRIQTAKESSAQSLQLVAMAAENGSMATLPAQKMAPVPSKKGNKVKLPPGGDPRIPATTTPVSSALPTPRT
ncbi:unnamed protein product [Notodromas monacha]|uniref:Uncharacterized protein n=1 Tax=Notodromas monacha TaxID=399045 RepID=A0A7R9BEK3_9CRUS|nr:unnamed protein product [Notodromas monacha]CAG0913346.1 unnamed protein product [Notodromas monacha]